MVKINDDINIHFPLKMIPRDQQLKALQFIKDSLNTGKKFILLDLAVGSGKTYLTNMLCNYYLNYINSEASFDILTESKVLQSQYSRENDYIKDFRGKNNYVCEKFDCSCEQGLEICSALKQNCSVEDCPYTYAKKQWIESRVGLTNFHMFDTLSLYVSTILDQRDSNVLIIDEAHNFEEVFSSYISTSTSTKSLKKYGFDLKTIEEYDQKIKRIKTLPQYVGFISNQFIPDVEKLIYKFEEQIKSNYKVKEEYSKYKSYCESQLQVFKNMEKEYKLKPENWVLDISTNIYDKLYNGIVLEAKPVWVSNYLYDILWSRYDHVIFLSGSILNMDVFCDINGLDKKLTTYMELPSVFPIKNRPIFFIKCGKMTMNEKEQTFKIQLEYIKKILARNIKHKGIIHTANYENQKLLMENLFDNRLIFHTPENKEEMLEKHINADYPSIIVSPSLISGVDLKDELGRFSIIQKIVYPYLGSNKVKQRQKTNPNWYNMKACQDFCQMYGRTTRSIDDWSETYVLDSCLSDLLRYNSKYIPRYVSDAIKLLKI